MKKFFKDKNRVLTLAIFIALGLSIVGYSMSIDNFTDYNPPDKLMLRWADVSRWSAEYPYRVILLGADYSGMQEQHYVPFIYCIYSKTPTTDLFTFKYTGGSHREKRGYIRGYINEQAYHNSDDIRIVYATGGGMSPGTLQMGDISYYTTYTSVGHLEGFNVYFDFDFYYECAPEHDTLASPLNVNGLRSVANVPYAYILRCDAHGGGGSASSGNGGSSSGGGSSGGGSNSNGDGGRHGWGDGEFGGGIDEKTISPSSDGGGYSDRSESEFSVPDDWKKPVEDDIGGVIPPEYVPEIPPYVPAEGDTGQDGSDWEFPSFDFNNDGVSGEINGYKELVPDGHQGYHEFEPGVKDWGYVELVPDGEYGLIDFMKPYGG